MLKKKSGKKYSIFLAFLLPLDRPLCAELKWSTKEITQKSFDVSRFLSVSLHYHGDTRDLRLENKTTFETRGFMAMASFNLALPPHQKVTLQLILLLLFSPTDFVVFVVFSIDLLNLYSQLFLLCRLGFSKFLAEGKKRNATVLTLTKSLKSLLHRRTSAFVAFRL